MEEAKLKKVVLPNKKPNTEESTFDGATRECIETGALFGIGKFDLTSAYPNMIINFCLDPQNVVPKDTEDAIEINNIYWQQNKEALLPSLVSKMLVLKDQLKENRDLCKHDSVEYKDAQIKYDAIKGVVNSAFGVMGFPGFRLYDNRIASTIAFLVRDLLMYVKEHIEIMGYKVVYWDTDSVFLKTTEDITDKLNKLIINWAIEKYNNHTISINFEYEGYFEKLFLLTKCRYLGYLKSSKGIKKEIKGVEIKRASSSKFESEFQQTLIDKLLNKENRETVLEWIENEKRRIKTLSIDQIAFPCKIGARNYKNDQIFIRAYRNTQKLLKTFNLEKGELFYYIYIKSSNPDNNVLAFTDKTKNIIHKDIVDYDKMIERNIINKSEAIFEAMRWDVFAIRNANQLTLV
jgi:DNA polymerase elongation subunit (family B)